MKKKKLKRKVAELEEEVLKLKQKIQELSTAEETRSVVCYENGEEITEERYQFYNHDEKTHYRGSIGRDPEDLVVIEEIVREGPC